MRSAESRNSWAGDVIFTLVVLASWLFLTNANGLRRNPDSVRKGNVFAALTESDMRTIIGSQGSQSFGWQCQTIDGDCGGNNTTCPENCTMVGGSCGPGGAARFAIIVALPTYCSDTGTGTTCIISGNSIKLLCNTVASVCR